IPPFTSSIQQTVALIDDQVPNEQDKSFFVTLSVPQQASPPILGNPMQAEVAILALAQGFKPQISGEHVDIDQYVREAKVKISSKSRDNSVAYSLKFKTVASAGPDGEKPVAGVDY